jgi:hypothetical protein
MHHTGAQSSRTQGFVAADALCYCTALWETPIDEYDICVRPSSQARAEEGGVRGMSMRRLCVGLLSALLLAGMELAYGAVLRNSEEAKELAEKVLSRVVVGDVERAFAVVKPYWPFPESELEALAAQAVQQRTLVANRLGKSQGFALVRRDLVADLFLRLTYVEKLEHTALLWVFTFYKAKDTWRVHSLVWDDDITKLFSTGH